MTAGRSVSNAFRRDACHPCLPSISLTGAGQPMTRIDSREIMEWEGDAPTSPPVADIYEGDDDMADSTPQRKFALTRIGKGDYLLPSNDAKTIWRIAKYTEDGDATRWDGKAWKPVVGDFWAVHQYEGRFKRREDGTVENFDTLLDDDPLGWHLWGCCSQGHRTRQEAIDEAIGRGI